VSPTVNPPPEDDRSLVEFLQQHRALPPPEASDLEDRLLAEVEQHPLRVDRPHPRGQLVWLLPPTIAAGLVATLLGYRAINPAQLTATETTTLESFIEANWQNTVTDSPTDNPLLSPDSSSN
jgi:hypothetical protein